MKFRLFFFVFILLLVVNLVSASNIIWNDQTTFDTGTYHQTNYNGSNLILNISDGFYTGWYWNNYTNITDNNWLNIEVDGDYFWSEDPDLLLYLPLDVDEDDESIYQEDCTNSGVTFGSGKINYGGIYDSGFADVITCSGSRLDNLRGGVTFSFWIKPDSYDWANDGFIIQKVDGWRVKFENDAGQGEIRFLRELDGTTDKSVYSGNLDAHLGTWYHVILVETDASNPTDSSTMEIYINNIDDLEDSTDGIGVIADDSAASFTIGNRNLGGRGIEGMLDEVQIFNRTLTVNERQTIYEQGLVKLGLNVSNGSDIISCDPRDCDITSLSGNTINYNLSFYTSNLTYFPIVDNVTLNIVPLDTKPIVELISPPDNYINTTDLPLTYNLTYNVTDDMGINACQLWHNDSGVFTLNQTSSITGLFNESNFTLTVGSPANFVWNVLCNDTIGQQDWGTNRTIIINAIPPVVTLVTENKIVNYTDIVVNQFFNYNVTDNIEIKNCSFWHNGTGTWSLNQSNITISGTSAVGSFNETFSDTLIIWNIECYDNNSNVGWGENYTMVFDIDDECNVTNACWDSIRDFNNGTYYNTTYDYFNYKAVVLDNAYNGWTADSFTETYAYWNNITYYREYGYELNITEDLNIIKPVNYTGLVFGHHLNSLTENDFSVNNVSCYVPYDTPVVEDGVVYDSIQFAPTAGGHNERLFCNNSPVAGNFSPSTIAFWAYYEGYGGINKFSSIFSVWGGGNYEWRVVANNITGGNVVELIRQRIGGANRKISFENFDKHFNRWVFVTFTDENVSGTGNTSQLHGYIDGVEVTGIDISYNSGCDLSTDACNLSTVDNPIPIISGGPEYNAYTSHWGMIDELTVWNRSLSADEVMNLYRRGVARLGLNVTNGTDTVDCGYEPNTCDISSLSGNTITWNASYESLNLSYTPELVNLTIDYTLVPNISDIFWMTTGGFSDDTLVYSQIMDYINTTATDKFNLTGANITVSGPTLTPVDNQPMICSGNDTNKNCGYDTDFSLDETGNWTISVTVINKEGETTTSSDTFTVSIINQSLVSFFGYDFDSIPSNNNITGIATYEFESIEIRDYASNQSDNWSLVKNAINQSEILNMKAVVTYLVDWNMSDTSVSGNASRDAFMTSYSSDVQDLLNSPYLQTVQAIKIDVNTDVYSDSNITINTLNIIGKNLTAATGNYFPILTNYNSSTLDDDYIRYDDDLIYLTALTNESLITQLANLTRTKTSLTRVYYNLTDGMKNIAKNYQNDVMAVLTSTINTSSTISTPWVSELINGDLIIWNNESITTNTTYNLTNGTDVIGSDLWDFNLEILLEADSDGIVTVLDRPAHRATIIGTEDLSYISYDMTHESFHAVSQTSPTLTTEGLGDTRTSASAGSSTRGVEIYEEEQRRGTSYLFYGELGTDGKSATESPYFFDGYTYVVINDKTDASVDKLFWTNISIGGVFGYISVANFNASNATWLADKKAEIDAWLALNESFEIFFDGLDTAAITNETAFADAVKELADYVKIDKNVELGINVFTRFQEFAQLASSGGFVMKESCIMAWDYTNGDNATDGFNYTNQYWNYYSPPGTDYYFGDYEKSRWYATHDVDVICVIFQDVFVNYTNTPNLGQNINYTLMYKNYLKAKVLGYDNVFVGTPYFRPLTEIQFPDTGEKLQREPSIDGNLFSMRYEKGIIHYNNLTDVAWFDDGRIFYGGELILNLHDNVTIYTYDICINDYCGYSITTNGDTWNYGNYSVEFNQTVFNDANGHFNINITSSDGGFIGDTDSSVFITKGHHSFYDDGSGWQLFGNGNHLVWVLINDSIKATIDTTDKITQTNLHSNDIGVGNISSNYEFNISIYSQYINQSGIFRELSIWNTTDWVAINYTSSSACITDSPMFNNTVVSGIGTVGGCIYIDGGNISAKVNFPKLSNAVFRLNTDDEAPAIIIITPENGSTYQVVQWINGTYSNGGNCSLNDSNFDYYSGNSSEFNFLNNTLIENGLHDINISCWDIWENNDSIILTFTVDACYKEPTITNQIYNCANNCNSSTINYYGMNVTIRGTGSFTQTGNMTNIVRLDVDARTCNINFNWMEYRLELG